MKKRGIALCLAFAVIAIATGIAHGRKQSEKQFVLDFEKIRAVTNATDWEILSRHHEHDLAIGTQTVSTQRIVAVCRVSENNQSQLTGAIEDEIDRQLNAASAIQKGEWSANRSMYTNKYGTDESIKIVAPRLLFAIGNQFGVLDLDISAHNGHATVVISCTQ